MLMNAVTQIFNEIAVVTQIDGHTIITEPPVSAGGSGKFPPATRMIIAALLNCSFSEVKVFCKKRSIPVERLQLKFCGNFEDGIYTNMTFAFLLPPEFPEKYKKSIRKIIDTCVVKRIINDLPDIRIDIIADKKE